MKKKYIIEFYINGNEINIDNVEETESNAMDIAKEKIKEFNINNGIFSITEIPEIKYNINDYNNILSKKPNKEELYDLLLGLSEGKKSYYDINCNLLSIEKINTDHFNTFSFKSLLGYHSDKFNIGDKIRFKYANNKCEGIIIGKYEKDCKDIYNSDDPYHFKEGYNVEYNINGFTMYNENWQEPYYDEDLELIKR